MLDAERPDAVVLVVPDTRCADLACLVLERALPLLLEKPPGRTTADVDRMLAAARRPGRLARPAPGGLQPPLRPARARAARARGRARRESAVQHVRYEMVRVNRRDADFSTTAIHGIDAVRYLAGADYAHARMRYQELPALGNGVANLFVDAVLSSGATAQLSFCPVAGAVVERACVHTHGHTLLLEVPMWSGFDAPGQAAAPRAWPAGRGTARRDERGVRSGRLRRRDRRVSRRGRGASPARARPRRDAPVAGARLRAASPRGGVPIMKPGPTVVIALITATALAAPADLGPSRNARLDEWRVIGPGGGGTMRRPAISPHDAKVVMLGCDMTGAYLTGDGGASWRMINFGSVPTAFAFDPRRPAVVYAGAEAVYKSEDAGRTWRMVLPDPAKNTVERSIGDHGDRVIFSDDPVFPGGRSVTVHAIAIDDDEPSRVYAALSAADSPVPGTPASATRLLGSTDGGRTWSRLADFAAERIFALRSHGGGQALHAIGETGAYVGSTSGLQSFAAPGGARFTSGTLGRDPRSGIVFAYATLPTHSHERCPRRRRPGLRRRRPHVARRERRTARGRPRRGHGRGVGTGEGLEAIRRADRRRGALPARGLRRAARAAATRPRREAVQRDRARRPTAARAGASSTPRPTRPRRTWPRRGSSRAPPRTATRSGSTRPTTSRSRRTTRPSRTRPTCSARTAPWTAAAPGRRSTRNAAARIAGRRAAST